MIYIKLDESMNLVMTVNEPIYRGDNLNQKITYLIPLRVGEVDMLTATPYLSYIRADGVADIVRLERTEEKYKEAQAGQFGAVTVATNMAGRGTDIMLGGNAEYMAKNDLRKAGLTDELIAEATGYAETDNQEILDARKLFAEKLAQHKAEIAGEADKVRKDVVKMVRDRIGPVAAFKESIVVDRLPKTRSGKILRATMVKIADGEKFKMPATIEDPAVLDEIRSALEGAGLAQA